MSSKTRLAISKTNTKTNTGTGTGWWGDTVLDRAGGEATAEITLELRINLSEDASVLIPGHALQAKERP